MFIWQFGQISQASQAASPDALLIERNARPLLAEGTLEALIPWETPLEGFFVRSHHNVLPAAMDDSWTVMFDGLLAKPKKISVGELKKRNQISFHSVLECSGNGRGLFSPQVSGIQWQWGAVGNAEWRGVSLGDLFAELGVKPNADYVTVEGFDEPVIKSDAKFVRSIPLKLLIEAKAILAVKMNRQWMPIVHGGPVRLVVPGIYGQNWVKWVTRMTFTNEVDQRIYAKKAYRMPDKPGKPGEALDPAKLGKPIEYIRVQSIFTAPPRDAKLAAGPLALRGKAFSGTGAIKKVEISLDAGSSWQAAKLSRENIAWQEFEYVMQVREGKSYEAWARATDSMGNVQPVEPEWNPKGYLYNAVDRVRFVGDRSGAFLAEGKSLAETHCQTCHSIDMAEGQRLSKNAWKETIKKMADFGLGGGAGLPDGDVEKIAAYFSGRFPPGMPGEEGASRRVDLSAAPSSLVGARANSGGFAKNEVVSGARGKKLFAVHCAACHGANGDVRGNEGGDEGNLALPGPALKGRALTDATFWSSVVNGKRNMPPFKDVLTSAQIADIRAWIQLPQNK